MSNTLALRNVPFFNYPHVFTSQEAELLSVISDVGRRGAFIMQRDLEEFERNLAAYVGARYVVGMANATDALHLALRAAGIGEGDEVVFSSHTMVATAAAIHFAGATPVPVDCGPDHLIDPACVEAAITPRTKAIMPTQLNGRTADMDALGAVAARHGLVIVEDAAQALGSRFKGRAAGTFGLAGAISFYPAKTLGCLGDGGCVMTDDGDVREKLLLLRDHGRDAATGDVVLWGINSRLDNLQAAILNHKLKTYDRAVARRREFAAMYQDRLGGLPQLRLPPAPGSEPDHFDIFQNYEIEALRRDALRLFLKEHSVGTLIQWGGKAVHQFPKLGFTQRLPATDELFTRLLMLPMNTSLADEDVNYVCDCIVAFYNS
ncbi:MAG: DegT/DnrJ/EryC1/StrS family aminotransferase [Thermoguttaceae bacterium]|jgi:dTDP-4-amino-4,6-dideoxygalactose transaminase